eukprot:20186-Heterococcus_DN1.PRE.1
MDIYGVCCPWAAKARDDSTSSASVTRNHARATAAGAAATLCFGCSAQQCTVFLHMHTAISRHPVLHLCCALRTYRSKLMAAILLCFYSQRAALAHQIRVAIFATYVYRATCSALLSLADSAHVAMTMLKAAYMYKVQR